MCPSRKSVASHQNYSKQFHNMSEPKFNCLSSKLFEDISIFRLSWNLISSHRSCSKTFPNCVLGIFQLHLIENILRQFQIVSEPKFKWISSKIFWSNSLMHLSRNSIASDWNCSKPFPICVLAEIRLYFIENNLRQF